MELYKTISELEELREAYYYDLRTLDEMRMFLHSRCSKLMDVCEDRDFYSVVEITHSSFKDIEVAMQKIQQALDGISMLIQKYQAVIEASNNFLI